MSIDAPPISSEHIVINDDDAEELMPIDHQSKGVQTIQDSSDDKPIAARRLRRNVRPSTHETIRHLPIKPTKKTDKRPGPGTHGSKPIKKNDMKAEKAISKEIETYWGKHFIKSYIPKCHREPEATTRHHGFRCYRGHARQGLGGEVLVWYSV
jgi:hypothetical protein